MFHRGVGPVRGCNEPGVSQGAFLDTQVNLCYLDSEVLSERLPRVAPTISGRLGSPFPSRQNKEPTVDTRAEGFSVPTPRSGPRKETSRLSSSILVRWVETPRGAGETREPLVTPVEGETRRLD